MQDKSSKKDDQVIDAWIKRHSSLVYFGLKVVCYTVILLALIYLYDYNGVTSGHFIYNEF
nr:teichoic acid D-Ala incorporation-associated protein DltX [Secundilactobacillus folii]